MALAAARRANVRWGRFDVFLSPGAIFINEYLHGECLKRWKGCLCVSVPSVNYFSVSRLCVGSFAPWSQPDSLRTQLAVRSDCWRDVRYIWQVWSYSADQIVSICLAFLWVYQSFYYHFSHPEAVLLTHEELRLLCTRTSLMPRMPVNTFQDSTCATDIS